jgi:putative membrane protein
MADRPDRTRDHLANERTLLAWIRTGVTLIGLGFVVARFSYLLRTLAAEAHSPPPAQSSGGTELGIVMVVGGAATILLALRRFLQTRAQIDRGDYRQGIGVLVALGLLSVAAAVSLAVYIGLSSQSL